METQAQERTAMYQHDIEIGKGASQWVINLRASVRPMVTYLFVIPVNRGRHRLYLVGMVDWSSFCRVGDR